MRDEILQAIAETAIPAVIGVAVIHTLAPLAVIVLPKLAQVRALRQGDFSRALHIGRWWRRHCPASAAAAVLPTIPVMWFGLFVVLLAPRVVEALVGNP